MKQKRDRFIAILLSGVALIGMSCASPQSDRPLLSAPPSAAADNDIYIADTGGRIRALRPDGTEQWTFFLPAEIARLDKGASPDLQINYLVARSDSQVFGLATEVSGHNTGNTILFALNGNHLRWQLSVPYPEQNGAPVAVSPTAIYEAGDDGVLYAFARSDGHQLWKYQVTQGALSSPMVGADGTIYVTGPGHNLHAVAPDGSQRWVEETQK